VAAQTESWSPLVPKEDPSLAILLPWHASKGSIIITQSGSPSHIFNYFIKVAICVDSSLLLFRNKISVIKKNYIFFIYIYI